VNIVGVQFGVVGNQLAGSGLSRGLHLSRRLPPQARATFRPRSPPSRRHARYTQLNLLLLLLALLSNSNLYQHLAHSV